MMQHQKYLRKTSETQKDLMIEYFETHHGAIDIVSANNTDGDVKRRIWSELSDMLNKVEGGVEKNDLKWSKTWADMKLYAKNRARSAKQGHMMVQARKPTDLDRRILRVTGHEDLLRDWEASVVELENTYEKIRIDDTEHEIVVTEGTDYEYIEEEELVNIEDGQNTEQEATTVRIERYFDNETTQYEYNPVKVEIQSNKRKRHEYVKHENPELIEIQEVEQEDVRRTQQTSQIKRQKQSSEDEDQTQDDSHHGGERNYEPDAMVGAINNLANALNSVATALSSFAEVAKSFNKR